jgi:hypothetical protein
MKWWCVACDLARAEVERLRAEIGRTRETLLGAQQQLGKMLSVAEHELTDLKDYAGHHDRCPAKFYSVGVPVFCNCGWDAMRARHHEARAALAKLEETT